MVSPTTPYTEPASPLTVASDINRITAHLHELFTQEEVTRQHIVSAQEASNISNPTSTGTELAAAMTGFKEIADAHQEYTTAMESVLRSWADEEEADRIKRHSALASTFSLLSEHKYRIKSAEQMLGKVLNKVDFEKLEDGGESLVEKGGVATDSVKSMAQRLHILLTARFELEQEHCRQILADAPDSPKYENWFEPLDADALAKLLESVGPFELRDPKDLPSSSGLSAGEIIP